MESPRMSYESGACCAALWNRSTLKVRQAKPCDAPAWRGLAGAGQVNRLRPGACLARFTVFTRRRPAGAREVGAWTWRMLAATAQ
jgi:hypothetical protein